MYSNQANLLMLIQTSRYIKELYFEITKKSLNVYFLLVLQVKLSVFTSCLHRIGVPLVLLIRPIICYDKKVSIYCSVGEVISLHKLFLNVYFLLVL